MAGLSDSSSESHSNRFLFFVGGGALLPLPFLWGGRLRLGRGGGGIGDGGGASPLPFFFHLPRLPTSHPLPKPRILTPQPPYLPQVCPLTELVGPRGAPQLRALAAVLSLLRGMEHGQPKCGVLGEDLVEPPQPPTLHSPSLSLHTTRTGRTSSPQTTMSLTCNKTGGGLGSGDKLNFLDNFFKLFRLICNVNF